MTHWNRMGLFERAFHEVQKGYKFFKDRGLRAGVKELIRTKDWYAGTLKGVDQYGNKYYEDLTRINLRQRAVIYADIYAKNGAEVPPEWHSWIHYKTDLTPDQENFPPIKYKMPHLPQQLSNYGVQGNYAPPGHIARVIMQPNNNTTPSEVSKNDSSSSSSPSSSNNLPAWNRVPPPTAAPPSDADNKVVRDQHTWSAKMEADQLNSGFAGGFGVGTRKAGRYKAWTGSS